MSFEDLPDGLRDIPVPDLVVADLLDLVLGPCDRLEGSIVFVLCDDRDRMLVPVVIGEVPRDQPVTERLQAITTVTAALAGQDCSVLIGVGQPTDRHDERYARAWVGAARAACEGRIRLLGVWSCPRDAAWRADVHP
jgi:hypothetical protein